MNPMDPDPVRPDEAFPPDPQSLAAPIIECAPLPMVEVEGPRHVLCFVNPAFCQLLQKTREELLGRPFGQIVRNGERCAALLDRVYETGEFETHVDTDHSAVNPAVWIYAMWPALGEDKKPARVVVQLTKSAQLHLDLAAMNEALLLSGLRQHELREEAERSNSRSLGAIADQKITEGALRHANDQLKTATLLAERASKAKDNFLATLSHELRTPLTPVLVIAASLREDVRLPLEVREQLATIERNVTLEARIIDDLLDLTRISQGKLHLRSELCDAHSLIERAIEIVRDEAHEKGIAIERTFAAKPSGLRADPARFQQVIWNLLGNAVKFTPPGGKISVRTSAEGLDPTGCWLRIEVKDTGIGIEPDHLERIFQPFDQGNLAGSHLFGGVGLGLAIARSMVVLHGGRIRAQSEGLSRGSTLIVEFPGAIEAPETLLDATPAGSTPERGRKSGPQLRLLLVEDHVASLRALTRMLQNDGHKVIAAANAKEALAAAAANPFDLVVSDLGLPDGSGLELMEKLRTAYGLRGVALSGYGMEDDILRSRAAGFAMHLVKPVAIAELRRVLVSLGRAA